LTLNLTHLVQITKPKDLEDPINLMLKMRLLLDYLQKESLQTNVRIRILGLTKFVECISGGVDIE